MTIADRETENTAERKRKTYARGVLVAGLFLIAVAVARMNGVFQHFGLSDDTADMLFGIATGFTLTLGIAALAKAYGCGASQTIDAAQRVQRRMLIGVTALLTGFGTMVIVHPLTHGMDAVSVDFSIEFILISIIASLVVAFGVGFMRARFRKASSDELVSLFRTRATRLGYLLAVLGLSAGYVGSIYMPAWTSVILAAALLAGIVLPAIYFLIADGVAGAGE